MKLNKFIITAMAGLCLATLAKADVYLTGSTAMRSTVYDTIVAPGLVFTAAPTFWGYGGKGKDDNYMAFKGTLVGGSSDIVIYCSWSGSEDGIKAVVSGNTSPYIDPAFLTSNPAGADPSATGATVSHGSDLAMADNAQAFSRNTSPALTTGTKVGVITFQWLRSQGLWTGTNVTDGMINQALKGGAKRAVFSGDASDTNDYVYVSGRDSGSGTRVNAFATSGFGILTTPAQVQLDTATNGTMTFFLTTNPIPPFNTITNYIGDWGFSSGGTLAKTLGGNTAVAADKVKNKTGFTVIAYAGVGDADAGVGAGATVLNYNGVPFTTNGVVEGQYTFWGNEYIYQKNGLTVGSDAVTAYGLLATNIPGKCDGRKAINLNAMHATRTGPTSYPTHN